MKFEFFFLIVTHLYFESKYTFEKSNKTKQKHMMLEEEEEKKHVFINKMRRTI